MGRPNYEKFQILPTANSPQPLDLPSNPNKMIPCYRLVEISSLIGLVFTATTQEGIAGIFVLVGNDYSKGGRGIGFKRLMEDKHADLIKFISDMNSYRIALKANDRPKLQALEQKFTDLLKELPQSDFTRKLTLSEFYRVQQATCGVYDP
ncbi:uncharacterized protein JCM6883_007143, partial [Sporobolomyces salmoneus]|uniref:uncharacterized protein n=1 Tax=Sporobolomyces salmoneus TaxID=183962 RepID=UPI003173D215